MALFIRYVKGAFCSCGRYYDDNGELIQHLLNNPTHTVKEYAYVSVPTTSAMFLFLFLFMFLTAFLSVILVKNNERIKASLANYKVAMDDNGRPAPSPSKVGSPLTSAELCVRPQAKVAVVCGWVKDRTIIWDFLVDGLERGRFSVPSGGDEAPISIKSFEVSQGQHIYEFKPVNNDQILAKVSDIFTYNSCSLLFYDDSDGYEIECYKTKLVIVTLQHTSVSVISVDGRSYPVFKNGDICQAALPEGKHEITLGTVSREIVIEDGMSLWE